jgi:hypothetical protein
MSEPDPINALMGMAQQAAAGMSQVQAVMAEAARPPRFEYMLITVAAMRLDGSRTEGSPFSQVNDLAREGWQLMPFVAGPLTFVMCRQLGAADEAADMLRQSEVPG